MDLQGVHYAAHDAIEVVHVRVQGASWSYRSKSERAGAESAPKKVLEEAGSFSSLAWAACAEAEADISLQRWNHP